MKRNLIGLVFVCFLVLAGKYFALNSPQDKAAPQNIANRDQGPELVLNHESVARLIVQNRGKSTSFC